MGKNLERDSCPSEAKENLAFALSRITFFPEVCLQV